MRSSRTAPSRARFLAVACLRHLPRLLQEPERIARSLQAAIHFLRVLRGELSDRRIENVRVTLRHRDAQLVTLASVECAIESCVHSLVHSRIAGHEDVKDDATNHCGLLDSIDVPVRRSGQTVLLGPDLPSCSHSKSSRLERRSICIFVAGIGKADECGMVHVRRVIANTVASGAELLCPVVTVPRPLRPLFALNKKFRILELERAVRTGEVASSGWNRLACSPVACCAHNPADTASK